MRRSLCSIVVWGLLAILQQACMASILADGSEWPDMLTPAYYQAGLGAAFVAEVDEFLAECQSVKFHHILEDADKDAPEFTVPGMGAFGVQKGPDQAAQHHAAVDLHVGHRATDVNVFAAHDGVVAVHRDADKYRHYISITKDIVESDGLLLGRLVTIYAHVDLDLDEAGGLSVGGKTVQAGDLISQHLYAETVGGPHLHFEIRYYRPSDAGTEEFYGFSGPRASSDYSEPSSGPWLLGLWNPSVGYGYGDPRNHGLALYSLTSR